MGTVQQHLQQLPSSTVLIGLGHRSISLQAPVIAAEALFGNRMEVVTEKYKPGLDSHLNVLDCSLKVPCPLIT